MSICQTMAPGKMLLCGEYAVLEGYPALVTAVDRYVICTRTPADNIQVSAQGIGPYSVYDRQTHFDIPQDINHFFKIACAVFSCARQRDLEIPKGTYHIDSSALYANHSRQKLGLGSSAGVCVAIAAQLFTDPQKSLNHTAVFELALAAHRSLARGPSSGVDVAASCFGGLLRFTLSAEKSPLIVSLQCEPTQLPILCVFTGHSQGTPHFVKAVMQAKVEKSESYRQIMDSLLQLNAQFETELFSLNWHALNNIVMDMIKQLEALGALAGIHIASSIHQRIAKIAQYHGGCAKPSGAGGGDIAICFIPPASQMGFLKDIQLAGLLHIPLQLAAAGVNTVFA